MQRSRSLSPASQYSERRVSLECRMQELEELLRLKVGATGLSVCVCLCDCVPMCACYLNSPHLHVVGTVVLKFQQHPPTTTNPATLTPPLRHGHWFCPVSL